MAPAPPEPGRAGEAVSRSGESARARTWDLLEWPAVVRALADRCATAAGERAALALEPRLGEAAARRALVECAEMRSFLAAGAPPLGGTHDVREVVEAASRGRLLAPDELSAVARTSEAHAELRKTLLSCEAAPLLSERARRLADLPGLVALVDGAVDERGRVRDDATPELAALRRRRTQLASRIESVLDDLRRDPAVRDALSDDFVTEREGRPVLPVKSDRRTRVTGILHGRSSSGSSVFIEPVEVVDLGNEAREVELDAHEEIQRILRELSAAVARHAAALLESLAEHAAIDLACARARLAEDLGAVEPELGGGDVALLGLAHPLLLLRARGARGAREPVRPAELGPHAASRPVDATVRNDVTLSGVERGLVISGPNTGGKTVLLKSLGLAALMPRAGLPACCRPGSRLPFFEDVFADIGDAQSLAEALSSFSGHVARLLDVLAGCEAASGPTLVLLDELMAGTDPVEGAALARSFLERLAGAGARIVVTTHLGALKAFAASDPAFVNAGLEFDRETLRPTYRVRQGMPGASAALAVASQLGVPVEILERARELAGPEATTMESLLAEVDDERRRASEARELAEAARRDAERHRADLVARLDELRRRDASTASAALASFDAELAGLRAEAVRVTRELQSAPTLPAAGEALRRLDDLRRRSKSSVLPGPTGGDHAPVLEPGASVRSRSLGRAGVVVDAPDPRGRVRVAFGRITVQLAADDLEAAPAGAREPVRPPAPREAREPGPSASDARADVPFTPQGSRNTCDLRGLRAEEALSRLSRFLEESRAGGERRCIVIHGHGTGALRAAVRESLGDEPRVEGFRAGGDGEGGDGVTVVLLT